MKAKIIRFFTSLFPIAKNRSGSCNRCGQCCFLPNKCFFIKYNKEGKAYCSIYAFRPPSCRKYPRSAPEHLTKETCGYFFESNAEKK